MFKRLNEFNLPAVGLGLIIGAGIGLIISIFARLDTAMSMIIGAAIGIVIGAIVFAFVKYDLD